MSEVNDPKAPKVDGQAFFIIDDAPLPFWNFLRQVLAAAGYKTPLQEVRLILAWLTLWLASAVEWAFWIFSLGRKQSAEFTRQKVE